MSDQYGGKAQRLPRADILRLPFRTGKGSYQCLVREQPRWTIDHIGFLLKKLGEDYDPEKVGCPKRRFTKREVAQIAYWVLYKKRPPWESHQITFNHRQSAFFNAYLTPGGFNAARAARIAGYSPRRAKQTGHDLLRKLHGC